MIITIPIKPFPLASFSGWTISAIAPYRDGEKSALCAPISPTTTNRKVMLPVRMATRPSSMRTTSATLHQTITDRLLKRSARYPAGVASRG